MRPLLAERGFKAWGGKDFRVSDLAFREERIGNYPLAKDSIAKDPLDDVEFQAYIRTKRTLRHHAKRFDQGSTFAGTAVAVAQAVMMSYEQQNQVKVNLNPWYLYHYAGKIPQMPLSIDTCLMVAQEHGIALDEAWDKTLGFEPEPTDNAKEKAKKFSKFKFFDVLDHNEIITCLHGGCPVIFGRRGRAVVATDIVDENTLGFIHCGWGPPAYRRTKLKALDYRYGAFAVLYIG